MTQWRTPQSSPRKIEAQRILEQLSSKTRHIVKLQALARGFIQRCRSERLLKDKADEDFQLGRLELLSPQHNNPRVLAISQQLGPFDYITNSPFAKMSFFGSSFIGAKLVKRSVVSLSDGVRYEGEWVESARSIRMGRGV